MQSEGQARYAAQGDQDEESGEVDLEVIDQVAGLAHHVHLPEHDGHDQGHDADEPEEAAVPDNVGHQEAGDGDVVGDVVQQGPEPQAAEPEQRTVERRRGLQCPSDRRDPKGVSDKEARQQASEGDAYQFEPGRGGRVADERNVKVEGEKQDPVVPER